MIFTFGSAHLCLKWVICAYFTAHDNYSIDIVSSLYSMKSLSDDAFLLLIAYYLPLR